jgi:hypothetical protein
MNTMQGPGTVETDLKPERVAEGLAAPWPAAGEPVLPDVPASPPASGLPPGGLETIEAPVRPERVQARLDRMPGWSLAAGGTEIGRARTLGSAATAADYAGFVLREAARAKQPVRVGLEGARVAIHVLAPVRNQARGAIGFQQLDFASALA